MNDRMLRRTVLTALAALAGCGTGEEDAAGLVARVEDYRLTVDQVVDLLVDEEGLAANVDNVESLANYWIDYTLLAEAVARDTTFSRLDLRPLVDEQVWQAMVYQLRDSVIQVDTFITPDELETLYDAEPPEIAVRARHIMLTYPVQATAAQRDSVRAALSAVRQQIVDGASFEVMARQVSHDVGSAAAGGDLGFFGRGEMVAPFERAAFALQPGQMSEIVETPMGLHLIRVDERQTQSFGEAATAFRLRVQGQRVQQAESLFVAGIEARVGPTVADGAAEVTKEIARNPSANLSGAAARRPLVEWDGGEVTVGEMQTLIRLDNQLVRQQLVAADDTVVTRFLRDVARRELLVEQAEAAGLRPSAARVDSLVGDAAAQLREAARMLGLMQLDQAPGEPIEAAIARAVEEALADNLNGATRFVPLGLVSFQLRERASFATFEAGIGQAILEIGQTRAGRALAPAEEGAPAADTTGGGQRP